MQLIEDHIFQAAEQLGRAFMRQHQRDLLGRGQQNVGRRDALARAARGRRVAGAGLEPDRQLHLRDRHGQVARDVDGERLERRDVERVDGGCSRFRFGGWRARSTRLGRKPASVLPPPVGAISSVSRPVPAWSSSANWCACGRQPRALNQPANGSGSPAGAASTIRLLFARIALLLDLPSPSHQFWRNSSRSSRGACPAKRRADRWIGFLAAIRPSFCSGWRFSR